MKAIPTSIIPVISRINQDAPMKNAQMTRTSPGAYEKIPTSPDLPFCLTMSNEEDVNESKAKHMRMMPIPDNSMKRFHVPE